MKPYGLTSLPKNHQMICRSDASFLTNRTDLCLVAVMSRYHIHMTVLILPLSTHHGIPVSLVFEMALVTQSSIKVCSPGQYSPLVCRENLKSTAASVYIPICLNQRNFPLLTGMHVAVLHP